MTPIINDNYNKNVIKEVYHPAYKELCSTPDQVERLGLAGIAATERNGIETRDSVEHNGLETRGSVERNGLETRSSMEIIGTQGLNATRMEGAESRDETEKFGFQNLTSSRLEGAENRRQIEAFGFRELDAIHSEGDKAICATEKFGLYNADKTGFYGLKNFEAVKDGFKDSLLQVCESTDKIICNSDSHFKDLSMQAAQIAAASQEKMCDIELHASQYKASIELQAAQNKAHIELEMTKNTAAIQLAATLNAKDAALAAERNQAALSKQIAECCCENKMLILEQTATLLAKDDCTQALIRNLEQDRLRDELNDAKRREELMKLRASLLPPLIPSVCV